MNVMSMSIVAVCGLWAPRRDRDGRVRFRVVFDDGAWRIGEGRGEVGRWGRAHQVV